MLKILLNTALGIILIIIWSRFVDLDQILSNLSKVNLIYLGPVVLFMFLSPVIRALRLKIFLAEVKKIRLLDLIFLNGAAMFLNFLIPIRAGDFAKGVYLNTKYNLNFGKSVIWVFLDRFLDFLTVLLAATALLLFVRTTLPQNFILILSAIFLFVLILTYLAIFRLDFSKKLVIFLTPLFIIKPIKIYFVKFSHFILESFSILNRHPKDVILMIGVTVLAYSADAAIWYFSFMALGVSQSYLKMYLGQLLSALTYLVPAAPGYVGSAEASGTLILSGVFGINPNLASAMIVLFHVTSAIFVLVFGLISIYSLKINLGLVFRKVFKKDRARDFLTKQ